MLLTNVAKSTLVCSYFVINGCISSCRKFITQLRLKDKKGVSSVNASILQDARHYHEVELMQCSMMLMAFFDKYFLKDLNEYILITKPTQRLKKFHGSCKCLTKLNLFSKIVTLTPNLPQSNLLSSWPSICILLQTCSNERAEFW